MDDGNYSERVAKGLSAGQMVFLFLAGAAVCALFFAAGFVVGFNEKSSTAAPVTEKLTESSDVPPVVRRDSERPPGETSRKGAQESKSAPSETSPEPMRPQPRTTPTREVAETRTNTELEPRVSTAVTPSKGTGSVEVTGGPSRGSLAAPRGAGMMIQVAATGSKADAEKMVKALQALKYQVVLATPQQAHSGDNFYRVQVGPCATRETAEKIRDRLIQDGFKQPFIKH